MDVCYAPLNFRDVMLAVGKLGVEELPNIEQVVMEADPFGFGLEYVGRRRDTGAYVMGFTGSRALATTVAVDVRLSLDVPKHWTIIVSYLTFLAYMYIWCTLGSSNRT